MSESKARARHRAANNGDEPEWARRGARNPKKLRREEAYTVAAMVKRIQQRRKAAAEGA